jgi:arabinose-5-phosphate isomerase
MNLQARTLHVIILAVILVKRLYLKAEDLYKQNAKPFVHVDTSLKEVIIEISKGRLGATAVVDKENNLKGIVTDGDVRRMLEDTNDLTTVKAGDIYNSNAKTNRAANLSG